MLPGYLAGHYSQSDCSIDLHKLCYAANARFYADEVVDLDLRGGNLRCDRRSAVRFDVLSLDIGSAPDRLQAPGAERHALPVKPVDRFMREWEKIEERIRNAQSLYRIAIVGGGAGGTELCLALQHRMRNLPGGAGDRAQVVFHLVSATKELLPTHGPRVRSIFAHIAHSNGIVLHLGRSVQQVTADELQFAEGEPIGYDALLWATNAAAPSWLRSTALALDEHGFIRVDSRLRSISHDNVFAAGDIASMEGVNLPKSGVYAVRQGPVLYRNLLAQCAGRALKRFYPQRRTLALISTGDRYAVASRGCLSAHGRWVWRAKDWIDRRWMQKYQTLRRMPQAAASAGAMSADMPMHCGGCAAKLGSAQLRRMLADSRVSGGPGILVGLDPPDDAAVIVPPDGFVLVQSVDYFRTFVDDPYRFARIATNHCLGDLYAMGAMAHSGLAIVTLPHGPDQAGDADLRDLMAGATHALTAAGAQLVGGHTGRGAELGFGMSVNGFAKSERLFRKGGLRVGDALILTKPLGTGAVFAGHMRGLASASWIERALEMMEYSNRDAVDILHQFNVVACTDVTGFGLIGHLMEMLHASGTDANLWPRSIPSIPGALALLGQGVESTLAPQNRALDPEVKNRSNASPPEIEILFDPQTAGGLLFGVRQDQAARCIDDLGRAGFESASNIGVVAERATERARIRLE